MAGQAKLSILIAAKDDSAGALAKASNAIGGIAKAAAVGAIGAGVAIAGMGVAAFKLGASFDEAYDTIRVSTGKTGEAVEGLKDDFRAVARDMPADFDQIGVAIGDLSARTGLTGKDLQDLAGDILNLTRIAGGDLKGNISTITRTFGDWGVATDDQSDALNQMFRATQKTGISMSSLNEMLVTFGAPLRQLGFSFAESAGLLGKFEKEGVNTELVMGSLRIALGKMAKAGQPVRETLLETVDAIKKAGSASEANAIALKLFGAKAGPDMAAAIREGRFELGELFDEITTGADTIGAAAADTEDAAEKWKKITNKMALAVEPLASGVFDLAASFMDTLGPAIEKATPFIVAGMRKVVGAIEGAIGKIKNIIGTVKGVFAGDWVDSASIDPLTRTIGNLAAAFRDMLPTIQSVVGWIGDKLGAAFKLGGDNAAISKGILGGVGIALASLVDLGAVIPGLSGVMNAFGLDISSVAGMLAKLGPIGMAVGAALAVGGLAWTQNWFGIREKLAPVFDWLKEMFGKLIGFLKDHETEFRVVLASMTAGLSEMVGTIRNLFEGGDGGGAAGFVEGIVSAFRGMGEAIMGVAGPVTDFVAPSFQRLWDAIGVFAVEVWPELQGAFNSLKATVETVVIPMIQNILTIYLTVFGGIADFIGEHRELVIGILKGMWQVIEGIVTVALAALKGVIMIGLNLIQGDWQGAWDAMTEMHRDFWNGIALIQKGATEILNNALALAWEGIKALTVLAWDGIKAALSAKWEDIKSNLASMMDAYQTLISAAWEAIKSAIATKSGELVGIVAALPGQITAALGNLGSLLWNAGASLIQGFIDGIVSKIAEVKRKLAELAGLLPSWKGPAAKDRAILFPAGQMVMQGFIAGLESQFGVVRNSLKATMGVVPNAPLRNAGAPGQVAASAIAPSLIGGSNNLAGIEEAVYRGAYRGTRAALAEAI